MSNRCHLNWHGRHSHQPCSRHSRKAWQVDLWFVEQEEYQRSPKTATLFAVPTYTLPLATIGVMNLLLLKLSLPPLA